MKQADHPGKDTCFHPVFTGHIRRGNHQFLTFGHPLADLWGVAMHTGQRHTHGFEAKALAVGGIGHSGIGKNKGIVEFNTAVLALFEQRVYALPEGGVAFTGEPDNQIGVGHDLVAGEAPLQFAPGVAGDVFALDTDQGVRIQGLHRKRDFGIQATFIEQFLNLIDAISGIFGVLK